MSLGPTNLARLEPRPTDPVLRGPTAGAATPFGAVLHREQPRQPTPATSLQEASPAAGLTAAQPIGSTAKPETAPDDPADDSKGAALEPCGGVFLAAATRTVEQPPPEPLLVPSAAGPTGAPPPTPEVPSRPETPLKLWTPRLYRVADLARPLVTTIDAGLRVMRLRLNPPELGGLDVRVQMDGADVFLEVHAENPLAIARLQDHAGQLSADLARQGLHLAGFALQQQHRGAGHDDLEQTRDGLADEAASEGEPRRTPPATRVHRLGGGSVDIVA
ncbi:MAG: flagellar hook-length control protein FliK [Deltaproteobacteria bacterium]|nr:flagellar hook-length control protein FliK [Deltaproteobacteria bacterium]